MLALTGTMITEDWPSGLPQVGVITTFLLGLAPPITRSSLIGRSSLHSAQTIPTMRESRKARPIPNGAGGARKTSTEGLSLLVLLQETILL